MYKYLSVFFISLLLLTACGGQNQGGSSEAAIPCQNTLVPIEVEFSWEPETGASNDEYVFKAIVTHEGIPVADANDVKFEIWEHSNSDYHFMEETNNEGDGVYTLDWTFPEDGVYYAYYHVTACDMHRMEKQMVVVGDVNVEVITAEEDNVKGKMDSSHSMDHEEEHDESSHEVHGHHE